jgi:hypothetical protein
MRGMDKFLFLIIAAFVGVGFWPQGSWAVEVFANGEKFSSSNEYQRRRKAVEMMAELSAAKPESKKTADLPVPKASPFDFDPEKGKTVNIAQDGTVSEEKGVTALPDWMVYDPAKGKTVKLKSVSQPDQSALKEGDQEQPSIGTSQGTGVVDRGRIAGVQPTLAQVVEQFQAARGTRAAQPVSSSFELEEGLRKALQSSQGVVLMIAGPDRVRLYDLPEPVPYGNPPDGQKTR